MKVSARFAPPAESEPLPEHIQTWVEETNAGLRPLATPVYDAEGPKLVIEVRGDAASSVRHWA
jgi:hypothetical protein